MVASAQLLNFGEVGLEELIDPLQQLTTRKFDGIVGVDSDFVEH